MPAQQHDYGSVILWVGVMIGCLVFLTAVLMLVRHRMQGFNQASAGASPFDDLRQMVRKGQISEAEFASLKAVMRERLKTKDVPAPEMDDAALVAQLLKKGSAPRLRTPTKLHPRPQRPLLPPAPADEDPPSGPVNG